MAAPGQHEGDNARDERNHGNGRRMVLKDVDRLANADDLHGHRRSRRHTL